MKCTHRHFPRGGSELYFKDERGPIRDLFVTRSGLERVLSLLQNQAQSA